MGTGTEKYYERRAREYDRVYEKPERQADITELRRHICDALAGRRVLEVAAGTGYWTQFYADRASRVCATDVNEATLEVARRRRRWPDQVSFVPCDAFALDTVAGQFDAVLAGFLWSHVPLDRLDELLGGIVARLEPRSLVMLVDNNYVPGSNHPITRTDIQGNTYQRRSLDDGSTWEVLKNFPTPTELSAQLARHGTEAQIRSLEYYWIATIRTHDG